MSTRVWRQTVAAETTRLGHPDTTLRLALASMGADPTSPLTSVQRQWIVDLAQRTTPLTSAQRERLRAPLLAWVADRMPRCYDLIAAQYGVQEPQEVRT